MYMFRRRHVHVVQTGIKNFTAFFLKKSETNMVM